MGVRVRLGIVEGFPVGLYGVLCKLTDMSICIFSAVTRFLTVPSSTIKSSCGKSIKVKERQDLVLES